MNLQQLKNKMIAFRDFYGGDLLMVEEVENAETEQQLAEIIENHRNHIEDMANDAIRHLDRFKSQLGLDLIS